MSVDIPGFVPGWRSDPPYVADQISERAALGHLVTGALFGASRPQLAGTWQRMKANGCKGVFLRDRELRLLSGKYRRPMFQKFGTCHPAGVMVRMADGTEKPVQDISVGDKVLSHTGRVRKVLDVGSRMFTGDLISVQAAGSSRQCSMTGDHPVAMFGLRRSKSADVARLGGSPKTVPTEMSWQKASDLKEGSLVLVPTPKSDNEYQVIDTSAFLSDEKLARVFKTPIVTATRVRPKGSHHDIPRFIRFGEEFGRILGLYAGEGCCEMSANGKPGRISWTFCIDEPHYANEVATWIRSIFGVKATIVADEEHSTIRVRVSSRAVAMVFFALCPGKEIVRRLDSIVSKSPRSVRKAFLRGWYDAEGHFRMDHEDGVRSVCVGVSSSASLMDAINGLCASLGIANNVNLRKQTAHQNAASMTCTVYGEQITSLYPEKREAITAGVTYKRTPCQWWKNEFGLLRKIQSISKLFVENVTVFSLEVEEDHSYVADGIAVHNCVSRGSYRGVQTSLDYSIVENLSLQRPVTLSFAPIYTLARHECGHDRCGSGDGAILADAMRAIHDYGVATDSLFPGTSEDDVEKIAVKYAAPGVGTPSSWIAECKGHTCVTFCPETLDLLCDCIAAGYAVPYACGYITAMPNPKGLSRLGSAGGHCRCFVGVYVDENGETQLESSESWGRFPAGNPQPSDSTMDVMDMPVITITYAGGTKELAPGDVGVDAKQFWNAIQSGGEAWAVSAPRYDASGVTELGERVA